MVTGLGRLREGGKNIFMEMVRALTLVGPGLYIFHNYTCARLSQDLEMVTGLGRLREGGRDIVMEVGRGPSEPGAGASGGVDDEECRDLNQEKQI